MFPAIIVGHINANMFHLHENRFQLPKSTVFVCKSPSREKNQIKQQQEEGERLREVRPLCLKHHYVHIKLTPVCDSWGHFLYTDIRYSVTLLRYITATFYPEEGTYCCLQRQMSSVWILEPGGITLNRTKKQKLK